MSFTADEKQRLMSEHGVSPELLSTLEALNASDAKDAAAAGVESKEKDGSAVVAEETPATDAQPDNTPDADTTEGAGEGTDEVQEPTNKEVSEALVTAMTAIVKMGKDMEAIASRLATIEQKESKRVAEKAANTPLASLQSLIQQNLQGTVGDDGTRVDGRSSLAKSGPEETQADQNVRPRTGIPMVDQWLPIEGVR